MTDIPKRKPSFALGRLGDLWIVLGTDRPLYAGAIAVQALAATFSYVVPLVPQAVIDGVFSAPGTRMGAMSAWIIERLGGAEVVRANLWKPGVVIAVAAVAAGLLNVLRGWMTARAAQRSVRRLRERVHARLVRLPVPFFDANESGDLLQRATSDVDTVQNVLANQIAEMGRAILLLLIAIPLMFAIDWRMAIASTVLAIPVVAFAGLYFRTVSDRFRTKDEAEGRLTAKAQENIAGIRVVRAFGRQSFERAEFRERNAAHRDADIRLFDGLSQFWALSDVTCLAQILLVLVTARRVRRATPVRRTRCSRLAAFDLRACGLLIHAATRCLMGWTSRWAQERPSPSWAQADVASQRWPPCCCGSMSQHRGASRSAGRTFARWTVRYSARALPACCSRRFSTHDRSVRTWPLCAQNYRWRRLQKPRILQQFMTPCCDSSADGKP